MTVDEAVAFLEGAARYFENGPTGGEDRAHWAYVYNARNCRKIADMLRARVEAPADDGQFDGAGLSRMPLYFSSTGVCWW